MNWNADFAGLPPIELPDGRKLETLADLRGLHPGATEEAAAGNAMAAGYGTVAESG